jgi:quinol monooxygenase YgiN
MPETSFRMKIVWTLSPGELRPIAETLQGLMAAVRVEPGYAGCSLTTEVDRHAIIRYVEDWQTEADLKRQLRSARFAGLAELMELASEPPTVEFSLAGTTRGLDYATEARSSVA